MENIVVRGARTHNLKNIDLSLPRNKLVVITGLSGSGKSSLAFDTLYAEGQRRYVESLSAYARQFLSMMEKPDVDTIEGLSPAIAIEQKTTSHNPRSTVGTVTEIYDYLRLLFARAGSPYCPTHHTLLNAQSVSQMLENIFALPEGTKIMVLAPLIRQRKGEYALLFENLREKGFLRVRVNGTLCELLNVERLDPKKKHTIEVVIDRIKVHPDHKSRLADSLETALKLSKGLVVIAPLEVDAGFKEFTYSSRFACTECGYSLSELEPRLFSFNNPQGACPTCDGLGIEEFFDPDKIVQQPSLGLASGAIMGWDRRNPYYFNLLETLSKHYGFDLDKPFQKLPKKIREILLYGSGDEVLTFHEGRRVKKTPFEGVIPNLKRRISTMHSYEEQAEILKFCSKRPCSECEGTRLRVEARNVLIADKNLPTLTHLSIEDALAFFQNLTLAGKKQAIAEKIVREICARLKFLMDVGLDYLNLSRNADTLSGGESQRIRLASQIGAGLVGVMYILDEPSIGLHQRDNQRLLKTLFTLRDMGNTVIVVEHDEEAILASDYIIDMGPGAGIHGGMVVAKGTPSEILAHPDSLTGQYLSHQKQIAIPKAAVPYNPAIHPKCTIQGARGNNLKNLTVEFPVGYITCITGVSGSGKSTLVNDTLAEIAARDLNGASTNPAPFDAIIGLDNFDKFVGVDQSPIGRTPRSNPATYTGLFTPIRELFAGTQEARVRGFNAGRFSFNVQGGRCELCQGDGVTKVEMHFLADIYVTCDVCLGKRYNDETLEVKYKGKSIFEVLEMTVREAATFFEAVPSIAKKVKTLEDVGLSYLKLGQNATTLSGGEAQRVKLAKELSKRDTGRTLYILDEPTTGLHFHDVEQLLHVLRRLQSHGNTVIVIEHNLDVIRAADWVIDLGPEGGHRGGSLLAAGTPEMVAQCANSHTGKFLAM